MSARPHRVQLSRKKGWKLPPGSVVVARPTKWGNPFVLGTPEVPDRETAVRLFKEYLRGKPELVAEARAHLRGKHLACWCPLDKPCHADVWLDIVNGSEGVAP